MHLSPMALKTGGEAGGKGSPAHTMNYQGPHGVKSPQPRIDVPVDTAGVYCQRNHDSTLSFLAYFVQILHFVRFTNANSSL